MSLPMNRTLWVQLVRVLKLGRLGLIGVPTLGVPLTPRVPLIGVITRLWEPLVLIVPSIGGIGWLKVLILRSG